MAIYENQDKELREQLLWLLRGGDAHLDFQDAMDELPLAVWGRAPAGGGHTPWRLLEHMRIAQWDILEFSRDPGHQSPPFPEGYWPETDAPPDREALAASLESFEDDAEQFESLITDPENDLFQPFPWGSGQNLLREALLLADHNAYHLGQLVAVRKALSAWPV